MKRYPLIQLNHPQNVNVLFWWNIQQADITKMTIQNCIELILLHFPNNSLSMNGGNIEKSPHPFPAATDPIQIASNV